MDREKHYYHEYKDDCISEVTTLIYQDRTTTKENLREKARSYAGIVAQKDRNSVQEQPENKYIRLR